MCKVVGQAKAESVIQLFNTKGLLARSVQQKNSQCLTNERIDTSKATQSVEGMFCDAWTLIHPDNPCLMFQMGGGDEGKRSVALLLDWTKTKDRIVSCHSTDQSSNKTFTAGAKTMPLAEVDGAMAQQLTEVKGKSEHNEVRTIQVDRAALVGLIWSPITSLTIFAKNEGKDNWEDTKPIFRNYLKKLNQAGVPVESGVPVFTYTVQRPNAGPGHADLVYLDFVKPAM